ncbi:unnamed protein product [Paramecium pentaurelia]|uniref:1-phosphatidylinositol 4-kinase n=1 Tax=Paramecium pentaurelia TaxID=43138 RepID=A0A8S1TH68_9CILI|nr:unnamed protein product [Paramecium pentaurelia]
MNYSNINDDTNYCCIVNRRRNSESFFANHVIDDEGDVLNTNGVLLQLYKGGLDIEVIKTNLEKVRLNPNWLSQKRDDLEYYIPQFINYLVFRDNHKELINFLINVCQNNFFFAHLTYFQLKSLSQIVNKKVINLKEVIKFLDLYTNLMKKQYGDEYLINGQEFVSHNPYKEVIQIYGTAGYDQSTPKLNASEINIQQYTSINGDEQTNELNSGFSSTINFWNDIIRISERLYLAYPQIISLKADLQRINQNLPSSVYIPFVKDQIRNYVVLNIVASESKVFSTKERSPFYICLEIYRPDVEKDQQNDLKQSEAITLHKSFLQQKMSINGSIHVDQAKYPNVHNISVQQPLQIIDEDIIDETPTVQFYCPDNDEDVVQKSVYQSFQKENNEDFVSVASSFINEIKQKSILLGEDGQYLFGESAKDQEQRIKEQSLFGNLKSWRLVHLIVKSGDNLKQEQFAMQLLSTIDQIFSIEDLPMRLSIYEVISLGPNYGLIEMVKDAITIDSLKRQLWNRQQTLAQFFDDNFSDRHRTNFLHSLVGYSLACYILQLKDRHNGNILLKRDGHLVHIDFGFFLGNAPGKGIEIENKVPFKLLSEYIEILGGVQSDLFKKFRELFYKGFMALRKHSDRILLLVKMMYSGQKNYMPCFKRGDKSITQLEERFFQYEDNTNLNIICQNIINSSIDNWRAKWYDKYQYFVQGIFY